METRRPARGRGTAVVFAVISFFFTAACTTHADRIAKFRESYNGADFLAAELEIDRLIAKESGVSLELVRESHGLNGAIKAGAGSMLLFLAERAMVSLALGDPATAVELLRKARDEFDKRLGHNAIGYFKAVLGDDESLDYQGADYEHLLLRAMLAIGDLLSGGGDAYAYAFQIGEKQEEIINSAFGEDQGYKPRAKSKRVALGAYIQGLIHEKNLAVDEGLKVYRRAFQYAGRGQILQDAIERCENGQYAPDGHGVLHVFYLAGRGPHLAKTHSPISTQATLLARIGIAIAGKAPSALIQTAVPVPIVVVEDGAVPGLRVSSGAVSVRTETILDVNEIAIQQLQANMPYIQARAMVRRAVKAAIAAGIERGVERNNPGGLGFLFGALFNVAATAAERADTRNWVSLPSQIQVARLPLPKGINRVEIGKDLVTQVLIATGQDSFIVVIEPNLQVPPVVLVDQASQVDTPPENVGAGFKPALIRQ